MRLTHREAVDIGDVDNIQDQVLREDDEGTHIIHIIPSQVRKIRTGDLNYFFLTSDQNVGATFLLHRMSMECKRSPNLGKTLNWAKRETNFGQIPAKKSWQKKIGLSATWRLRQII